MFVLLHAPKKIIDTTIVTEAATLLMRVVVILLFLVVKIDDLKFFNSHDLRLLLKNVIEKKRMGRNFDKA